MKFILGIVVGAIAYWLYRSRGQQSLSGEPEFVQQARQSASTIVTASAQRTAAAIDKAPLPQQVKDVANRATTTVQARGGQYATSTQPPANHTSDLESSAGGEQTPRGDLPPEAAVP
jgi:hypothetical protein